MEYVFKIYGENFPKSKKLYITFLNLYLSERETNENDEEIVIYPACVLTGGNYTKDVEEKIHE